MDNTGVTAGTTTWTPIYDALVASLPLTGDGATTAQRSHAPAEPDGTTVALLTGPRPRLSEATTCVVKTAERAAHDLGHDRLGAVHLVLGLLLADGPEAGRLRNLASRVLVRVQDLEFRTAISAIQLNRRLTRSVGMGGNGQLTRMTALDAVCERPGHPWGGTLLEDFELGIQQGATLVRVGSAIFGGR